jgi:hypothetical protein
MGMYFVVSVSFSIVKNISVCITWILLSPTLRFEPRLTSPTRLWRSMLTQKAYDMHYRKLFDQSHLTSTDDVVLRYIMESHLF